MNQSVTIDLNKTTAVEPVRPQGVWQKRLSILLVLQVLLIIGVFVYNAKQQHAVDARPLLGIKIQEIDRVLVSDANGSAELKKSANHWQLPALEALPADGKKLTDALAKLAAIKLTWPVTTTRSAHERFEVAEQGFQRRIELFQGDTKRADILLGSTPGFKKVHVRQADTDEVYAVELNSFDFPALAKDWLQKDVLAIAEPEMIKAGDYHLQKEGGEWRFLSDDEMAAAPKIAQEKLTQLANALANLQVQELASSAPEQGEHTTLRVKSAAGEWELTLAKTEGGYFVKRSDKPQWFTLSQYEYDRIAAIKKEDLINKTPAVDANTSPDVTAIAEKALEESGLTP